MPVHPDETDTLIRASLFTSRVVYNPSDPIWKSVESYDQPLFRYYMYGYVYKLKNLLYPDSYQHRCIKNNNIQLGTDPNPYSLLVLQRGILLNSFPEGFPCIMYQLITMRMTSIVLSLGVLLTTYFIATLLFGSLAGLIGTALLISNTTFLTWMVPAMGDAPLLFFITVHLYLSLLFIRSTRSNKKSKPLSLCILIGVVSGLATATKLNGVLTVFSFCLVLIVLRLRKILNNRQIALFAAVTVLIVFNVFKLFNPFIWPTPFINMAFMTDYRLSTMKNQRYIPENPGTKDVIDNIQHVITHTLLPSDNNGILTQQYWYLLSSLMFFFAGIVVLLKHIFQPIRDGSVESLVFIAWSVPVVIITTLMIGVDWGRYYLPIVLVVKITQAVGCVVICNFLISCLKSFNGHIRSKNTHVV